MRALDEAQSYVQQQPPGHVDRGDRRPVRNLTVRRRRHCGTPLHSSLLVQPKGAWNGSSVTATRSMAQLRISTPGVSQLCATPDGKDARISQLSQSGALAQEPRAGAVRLMVMRLPLAALGPIAALGGLLAMSACTSTGSHTAASLTAVSGSMRMTGGPLGAPQTGATGDVTFTTSGTHAVAHAAADGSFSTSLAPGTYTVTGTSPQYGGGHGICNATSSVVVSDTALSGVVVACSRK